METFGYIHLALAYETVTEADIVPVWEELKLFERLNWRKLSSRASIHFLSLVVGLSLLAIASQALAGVKLGSRGEDVKVVQQRLQELGYFNSRPNGNFGSLTRTAVIRFQRDNGLTADGEVGRETEAVLFSSRRLPQIENFDSYRDSDRLVGQRPIERFDYGSRRNLLQRGDRGEDVSFLQQLLARQGFYYGNIDGVFGSQTEQGVLSFQRARNLFPDGIAETETLRQLGYTGNIAQARRDRCPTSAYSFFPKNRYVVVIPGTEDRLRQVRAYQPDAVLERSNLGCYVNAGEFPNRQPAENLSKFLQAYKLNARVVYRRR
jgi:peptidoglycan hydrolase-like protein with peptidoglycan-binding domain